MSSTLVRSALRAAAVVIAALALYALWWMPLRADYLLRAMDADTGRIEDLPEAERVTAAHEHLDKLARFEPFCRRSVDYYMIRAANERMANDTQRAVDLYTVALTVDRRPEIYLWRGQTEYDAGKRDAAIADFTAAVRFNQYMIYAVPDDLQARIQASVYPGQPMPPQPRWARNW